MEIVSALLGICVGIHRSPMKSFDNKANNYWLMQKTLVPVLLTWINFTPIMHYDCKK